MRKTESERERQGDEPHNQSGGKQSEGTTRSVSRLSNPQSGCWGTNLIAATFTMQHLYNEQSYNIYYNVEEQTIKGNTPC